MLSSLEVDTGETFSGGGDEERSGENRAVLLPGGLVGVSSCTLASEGLSSSDWCSCGEDGLVPDVVGAGVV